MSQLQLAPKNHLFGAGAGSKQSSWDPPQESCHSVSRYEPGCEKLFEPRTPPTIGTILLTIGYMDVSENSGTQQPWVFLLKMIILGCFGGTTI